MDAFSMALSIGTLRLEEKTNLILAGCVGAFHFMMPALGTWLGNVFVANVHFDGHLLSGIIFLYIAIVMFKDFKKEEEVFNVSFLGTLAFAFGVSLDSFGVGFALLLPIDKCIKTFMIFTLCSAAFTYVGLRLGGLLHSIVGEYSVLVGAAIMALFGFGNILQVLII